MKKCAMLVCLLSGSMVLADDVMESRKALDAAKVTFKEAAATAQKEVPQSTVIEVELDWDDNAARYEVEVLSGERIKEVLIDATTGKVIRVETDAKPDDKDDKRDMSELKRAIAGATKSFEQAREVVAKESPDGRILKMELELHTGKPAYEVKLLNGDKLSKLYVDAAEGKVMR